MFTNTRNFSVKTLTATMLVGSAAVLSACSFNTGTVAGAESIGFREARFAEISAMRDYRKCRDDALKMDEQARKQGSAAKYLASARLLEKCEAEIGPENKAVAEDERIRAYALSVQNHFKGGDIGKARENLKTFRKAFPDKDLHYSNGASFIDTMEVILGIKSRDDVGAFNVVNMSPALQGELRRLYYWKNH